MRRSTATPPGRWPTTWRCAGLGKNGTSRDFTYATLRNETKKFANVLRSLSVGKDDRVFALMGRIPELYLSALGTLKNLSVFSPLFSAFGPEPIHARLGPGESKVLVTTASLYRRKVAGIRERLPRLEHVILIREDAEPTGRARDARLGPAHGRGRGGLRDPADGPGGHGAPALHERHPPGSPKARSTSTRRWWPTT
jgi:acetyl-CoA synthetase